MRYYSIAFQKLIQYLFYLKKILNFCEAINFLVASKIVISNLFIKDILEVYKICKAFWKRK
jgi:hypothetical protein